MSDIKVYTTATCPWCTKIKDYLSDKGLKYQEIDVGKNSESAEEMIALTGQRSVPVTVIDGEVIVGFDREALDQQLS
ncbi:MAG TPA: NrdH-redoxin [Firmicutes bacterium]|jgi:glutaredoxin-like YruB-family protein|nr:NrdH-redoxin [Bacillota bacterium]HAZ21810.1 NrdH-redoxin [Bacillota bacterium]HBE06666.1 NrdH-redoxin [Bacillota bacterium]HBG44373.1 NrdH-redoxin [Bacillota bacterium]HBL50401.1 NrdH-redoxin [Bacillota bacterium]